MNEDCYQKLATHLDRLPGGFAPSETGAELALLAKLFTPEEAELAVHLTLDQEAAAAIAGRAGLPLAQAAPRLEEMTHKGLILLSQRGADFGAQGRPGANPRSRRYARGVARGGRVAGGNRLSGIA